MKAIILLLILLPTWAQGDIAVGIGNGLSIGVDGGGLYYSPPGSGVSIEIDSPEPKRNRNNNAGRNNHDYDEDFIGYEQPWPQEKTEPQIMPSVPSAPSVGKIHQIHRKECFLSSRRTDESNYKHRQIVGCIPKKSAFHRALVDDAQGKGTRLRDLLVYYNR